MNSVVGVVLGILVVLGIVFLIYLRRKVVKQAVAQQAQEVKKPVELSPEEQEKQREQTAAYIQTILNYHILSNRFPHEEAATFLSWEYDSQTPEKQAVWDTLPLDQLIQENIRRAEQLTGEYVGKLEAAFLKLQKQGFITGHDAGPTRTDGNYLCGLRWRERQAQGEEPVGCVFYHQQDMEHAIAGDGSLYLGYNEYVADEDSEEEREASLVARAEQIIQALTEEGLQVQWNGSPNTRIKITPFFWDKAVSQKLVSEELYKAH